MDSVIAQTYKNLEILIIDDGSTDSSGKICDEYAQKDSRIRVIHQENVGLAEVRNVGIRECRGEWIQFVDSDDWIDPETVETCYRLAGEYGADIVVYHLVGEFENGKHNYVGRAHPQKLMSSAEALSLILFPGYVSVSSCNKFIRREMLKGVEYPRGVLYEDAYTTYKILANADKVLGISNGFYHHFQRSTSISHTAFSSESYLLSEEDRKCFSFAMSRNEGNKKAQNNLRVGLWCRNSILVNWMVLAGAESIGKEYISQLRRDIRPLLVLGCPYIGRRTKIKLLLFKFSFKFYSRVYLRFRRDKA